MSEVKCETGIKVPSISTRQQGTGRRRSMNDASHASQKVNWNREIPTKNESRETPASQAPVNPGNRETPEHEQTGKSRLKTIGCSQPSQRALFYVK